MAFKFRKDLDLTTQQEKDLKPDYQKPIDEKIADFKTSLEHGLMAFNDLDLTQASKDFRKIANDLKHLESLITTRGKSNPKNSLNDLTGKEWLSHTKSWVIVDGKSKDITKEIEDHPASFPPELAEHFILFFTKQNDWVFDPFMGIGSTAAACNILYRNCIGIELNEKYNNFTRKRINITLSQGQGSQAKNSHLLEDPAKKLQFYLFNDDIRNAIKIWKENTLPLIDFLITSPPYWNMLKKSRGGVKSMQKQRIEEGIDAHYSDNPADLGNIEEYDHYLDALYECFHKMQPVLKPNAYLMIILQNCRTPEGTMQPIAWDFANRMKKTYLLKQEFIWLQDQKFMGIWGWPTTYVSNVHHHYCLMFQNHS